MKQILFPVKNLAIVALFACGVCAQDIRLPAEKAVSAAQEAPLKPRNDIKGLSNFAKVSDVLYRGAQPKPEGFAELKKLGIKTIVNLRARHPDAGAIKDLGFKYYSVPTNTWSLTDKHTAQFLKIVLDPANQPVFVHCQHGSDRTGTMVAVYRIYAQKWNPENALKELPVFGFHKIWANLKRYLKKLDIKRIEAELKKLNPQEQAVKP